MREERKEVGMMKDEGRVKRDGRVGGWLNPSSRRVGEGLDRIFYYFLSHFFFPFFFFFFPIKVVSNRT